jgi:polyphenol oxidase
MIDKNVYPFLEISGIKSGFSTAVSLIQVSNPGMSDSDMGINTITPLDVTERNRASFIEQIGLDPQKLAIVRQVHGADVLYADKAGILGDADGLVTNIPGLSVGVLVADCAAVLVCDPQKHVVGAFHAGWRGAVGGILVNGIQKMRELGGTTFTVWVSPCIGLEAFEVGQEVAQQFPDEFVDTVNHVKPHVDLKGFIVGQLQDIGVHRDRIYTDSRCTFHDSQLYSYRRQGKESGRMLGVIGLDK